MNRESNLQLEDPNAEHDKFPRLQVPPPIRWPIRRPAALKTDVHPPHRRVAAIWVDPRGALVAAYWSER